MPQLTFAARRSYRHVLPRRLYTFSSQDFTPGKVKHLDGGFHGDSQVLIKLQGPIGKDVSHIT